jgi:hypothetical protein
MGAVLVTLAGLSAASVYCVQRNGWTLYYGDAESHLDTARRVVDSRTPGYDQLGTVWLPLPHVLMLPFVWRDDLWRSGLAGAIPGAGCFVCAGMFLFAAARRAFQSTAAALAALGCFATNPNLLYLQSTPMTEPVLFMAVFGLLYCTLLFHDTRSLWAAVGAALASLAASLTRYEGWFLIPFVALYFLIAGRRKGFVAALVFGLIASLAPLYWLAHNWWYYGNYFEFFNGQYSAKGIYQRALDQGMARAPGDFDFPKAALYYLTAGQLAAGWPLLGMAGLGVIVAFCKRAWWPVVFLALAPCFYCWSLYSAHSSGTTIFVPTLWPHTYYNTRYGLALLPLAAFSAGALALLLPGKWRLAIVPCILAGALVPWLLHPTPEAWVCWKESQVNSEARRAWTRQAARYLRANYRTGDGIFSTLGDLAGVYREAGIPLREVLHEGNEPMWEATVARPDLFLHETWVVAIGGDAVASAIQHDRKNGPSYEQVQTITVKDAPAIQVYRRSGQ